MSKKSEPRKAGIFIKTFGCLMNEYDSEKMLGVLQHEFDPVDCPEEAGLVLINTCSVREKGEHKLFSLLGGLRDLKRSKPELIIGVGGCVAQQEGREILKRAPYVDFVVGTHNLSLIPSLVERRRGGAPAQVAVDWREEWEDLPDDFAPGLSAGTTPAAPPVRALVAIQRGCNKQCAFCVVPTTRGREVSRELNEILREIKLKLRMGAREVVLLGQTVNSWGKDLAKRSSFEALVKETAALDGVKRIRFTSPHPQEVRPGFIELYRSVEQLCAHIHLPLQSGSDRILALMNRNYRLQRYHQIVDALREARPDIALGTDLIVGFPTESEHDFAATLQAVRQVGYNSSYSFKYSRRPNTSALTAFSDVDEVPDEIAQKRLLELQAVQEEISLEINRKTLGTEVEVLVEGPSTNISSLMRGRTPANMNIEVDGERTPSVGELVRVVVEHAGAYGLRGRLVPPS